MKSESLASLAAQSEVRRHWSRTDSRLVSSVTNKRGRQGGKWLRSRAKPPGKMASPLNKDMKLLIAHGKKSVKRCVNEQKANWRGFDIGKIYTIMLQEIDCFTKFR